MRRALLILPALVLALIVAACGGGGSDGADATRLTLVAYSTPREAYEEIIPAFQRTEQGAGVRFDQSYGSSGEQSRAVDSGLDADVVAFSLEPDVTRLVEAELVAPDWRRDPQRGMVTRSVVVFAVRKGNPKRIRGWDDLLEPGVEVINPNPFTSGGARWNVMAAYGAQREQGRSHERAVAYLERLFRNISVQDKSARESLQTFASGKGDVLLAYENEAITAQQKGEDLDYVVPRETILIENPVAVVTRSDHPAQARAFVRFLRSPQAQRVFAQKGYRPVTQGVAGGRYPTPPSLFTIAQLGGWAAVTERFFDRDDGIVTKIQRDLGSSTG